MLYANLCQVVALVKPDSGISDLKPAQIGSEEILFLVQRGVALLLTQPGGVRKSAAHQLLGALETDSGECYKEADPMGFM